MTDKELFISMALLGLGIILRLLLQQVEAFYNMKIKHNVGEFHRIKKYDDYELVYNDKTMVVYMKTLGWFNKGIFTLLVNEDGLPVKYEEE